MTTIGTEAVMAAVSFGTLSAVVLVAAWIEDRFWPFEAPDWGDGTGDFALDGDERSDRAADEAA